ncbi:MAG: tRNA lysidine(34) synthetase TilS [Syntrophomonas sp.]
MMLNKVREFIKAHEMIRPGDFIILGISGGPDSMALLCIMKELQKELDFKIAVAHLNHGLRPEAENEEKLVREYCTDWEIAFYAKTLDIRAIAGQEKKSLEEAGRDYRYQFFYELLTGLKASKIATAHHKDDMAETVLLHLLRGSGIKGLRGIMPVKDSLIRPLLVLSKSEIEAWLNKKQINYCIDSSNYELSYLRNRIRHQLIPLLQNDYNPRIVETLNRLADIAREENDVLEEETWRWWDKLIIKMNHEEIILDKKMLLKVHPALQRRLILKILSRLQGEAGWDMADVQKIIDLAAKEGSSKHITLKKHMRVQVVYKQLHFTTQLKAAPSFNYEINIPGRIHIVATGETYVFEICEREEFKPGAGDIGLDYEKLEFPLYLRSRQAGDCFRPAGGQGRRKIKDYFIDHKIPLSERDRIPLLASRDYIYAVLGFRISSLAAAGPDTRKILLIRRQE